MPYSYTGASYTYIPNNPSGIATTVVYPLTVAGGTTTDDKQSVLVNATRVNIMAVIVTKVGTGTLTIAGAAAVLAITPSVAGPIDLGPIGLEMAGGFRVSCPPGSTNNILVIWEKIS